MKQIVLTFAAGFFMSLSAIAGGTVNLEAGTSITLYPHDMTLVTCASNASAMPKCSIKNYSTCYQPVIGTTEIGPYYCRLEDALAAIEKFRQAKLCQ